MKLDSSRYWVKIGMLLTIVVLGWGCQKDGVQPEAKLPAVRELSGEERELVKSVNDFAFDLVRQATHQSSAQNVFLSPLSVNLAMSLMLNGSAESTREQLYQFLDFDVLSPLEINKAYSELIPFLQELDPEVDFSLANAIWYDQRLSISTFYQDMLLAYYNAHAIDLNFKSKRAGTVIQKWVENQMPYKLSQPLTLPSSRAKLYMTNAVQFSGKWAVPFREEFTRPAKFYLPNGNSITTDMMYADQAAYRYHETELASYIDIPYGNQQYSMTLVMPKTEDSLHHLAGSLNAEKLSSILDAADTLEQGLYLPKFAINYQVSLKNMLSQLGMGIAFQDSANFSLFFSEANQQPHLNDMLHQASIEISEIGAKAASLTSTLPVESTAPSVRIDRSFLFFIREQHSGVILFAGILTNPVI
ncbi:serpin family protein [Tunicatimonas pelagia]|uniref:serpin family protein n=1 Tax=Tunicatimonas pelagia TaxID=931531 RepID=UPI002664EA7B|nr:serpin family protein [Tunicatimonas pelagia]WKN42222.1 serpin family protein [Tunicatimonas pelagia]